MAKLIQELYTEKIAKTKREKQTMHKKILTCCDKWVEDQAKQIGELQREQEELKELKRRLPIIQKRLNNSKKKSE